MAPKGCVQALGRVRKSPRLTKNNLPRAAKLRYMPIGRYLDLEAVYRLQG